MDILYFLFERTRFIRYFYKTSAEAFVTIKRKIEDHEDPYIPGYSEDGEPPFTTEWLEADLAVDVVGQACVSMLATALNLYCREWVDRLYGRYDLTRVGIGRPEHDNRARKQGWINAYRSYFDEKLKIHWEASGTDIGLLEQIILARNSAQHPQDITSLKMKQTNKDYAKYRNPFFVDEFEARVFPSRADSDDELPMRPWSLNISAERLIKAIEEVERFCKYMEEAWKEWPNPEFEEYVKELPDPEDRKA